MPSQHNPSCHTTLHRTHVIFPYMDTNISDNSWHFICFTLSGTMSTGQQVTLYFDGQEIARRPTNFESVFNQAWTLTLLPQNSGPFRFTEFNLWNSVLPPDTITEYAQSCNAARGNALEWYDFRRIAQRLGFYKTPSTCISQVPVGPNSGSGSGSGSV